MSGRQKRLKSIQGELEQMYEDLFGQKYISGLQQSDKTEFNTIIDAFRAIIFTVKQTQDERRKKEARKGFKQSTQCIKINHEIRQNIIKAQQVLAEAVRRMKNDTKNKDLNLSSKLKQNRERTIKNGYELLKDVKEIEQGGTYKPPKPTQTLSDIKKNLLRKSEMRLQDEEINLEEEQQLDKMRQNDVEIEQGLEEINQMNQVIKKQAIQTNQLIDQTAEQIKKNMNKADRVGKKVLKSTNDLEQVLKNYRRPNKLCLDLTLIFLILALIGVIINMIKNS